MQTVSGNDPVQASRVPGFDPEAPSLRETLAVVVFACLIFYLALFAFGGLALVGGNAFGDNPAYLDAASAIRHWQFAGVTAKQFWGVSYAVAGLSAVTGLSLRAALVIVCFSASLAGVALCYRLWGGWVALFSLLLSLDWFQRTLLGGAEPLFILLVLAAFLLLRRGSSRWSALSGALATVVRPFGLFALAGLGLQLLWQRRIRECFQATVIALLIGAAYAWPLAHYLGNPLANVTTYQKNDWRGGLPFSFPLVTIVHDTLTSHPPLTNLALTTFWLGMVLAGLVFAVGTGDLRRYARSYPAEACFVCIYCLALFTYASPDWARSNFPRFALPVLPWMLVFLYRFLPKQRWVVRSLAVVTPVLAAASAVGIRNVAAALMRHLH